MNTPTFAPGTSEADVLTLDTRAGRARLFNKRIDELMRTKGCKNLDEAVFALRTSEDPNDIALLGAMGETSSLHRTEKLKAEKLVKDMHLLGKENARALETSPEVKAAMKVSNSRQIAFNVRVDELLGEGFSFDQAILQMRANPKDAALLAAMGAA